MSKKISVSILSLLLMFTFVVGIQQVSLVSANGIPAPPINYIYIRSNGTIEPETAPITRNGDTYTLTAEMLNASVIVQRDNIVIDGAGYGIHGYSTHYYDGIIISYRTNITIKNTNISPFGYGVRMDYAYNNTITGNNMSVFTGVSLLYSDYNKIIGNTITDGYGVQGLGSYNLIQENNFTSGLSGGGNGKGVSISGNNNTITRNIVIHEVSIDIGQNAQYNTISYNTILNGRSGILLARASNNYVYGNTIKGKLDDTGALYISHDSFNNIIYENNFENNVQAVSLGAQVASSVWNNVSNNTFYRNNFINNTNNVWIAPGAPVNNWDYNGQGNYWSSFQGVDSNSDGISETPYIINANNTDHHPLMAVVIDLPPSASPSPTTSSQPTESTPSIPELTVPIWMCSIILIATLTLGLVYLKKQKGSSKI